MAAAKSIVVMKPRSDLCWQCQQNRTAIVRTANRSEAEKSTAIASALQHLEVVKSAREHYKTICQKCKESVHAHFVSNGQFSLAHHATPLTSKYTTRSITLSRCTTHLIPCNWVQSTFSLHVSVRCLVSVVKLSRARSPS